MPPPEQAGTIDFKQKLSAQIQSNRTRQADLSREPGAVVGGGGSPWRVTGRRLFAFLLDGIMAYFLCRVLAIAIPDQLRNLGEEGWWVGVAVAAGYFALFDSNLTKGVSLGKRLCHIEVQRVGGGHLNPISALLRFIPIGLVMASFFATRYSNPYDPVMFGIKVGGILLALIIGTFAIAHPMRRSPGDLLSGALVVKAGTAASPLALVSSGEPKAVSVVLVILILIGLVPAQMRSMKSPSGEKLSALYQTLAQQRGCSSPRLSIALSIGKDLGNKLTFGMSLVASVHVNDPSLVTDERKGTAFSGELVGRLIASGAIPESIKRITIQLRSGYDTGLWREVFDRSKEFPTKAVSNVESQMQNEPTVIYRVTPGASQKQKQPKKDQKQDQKKDQKK